MTQFSSERVVHPQDPKGVSLRWDAGLIADFTFEQGETLPLRVRQVRSMFNGFVYSCDFRKVDLAEVDYPREVASPGIVVVRDVREIIGMDIIRSESKLPENIRLCLHRLSQDSPPEKVYYPQ